MDNVELAISNGLASIAHSKALFVCFFFVLFCFFTADCSRRF